MSPIYNYNLIESFPIVLIRDIDIKTIAEVAETFG